VKTRCTFLRGNQKAGSTDSALQQPSQYTNSLIARQTGWLGQAEPQKPETCPSSPPTNPAPSHIPHSFGLPLYDTVHL